MLAAIFTVVPLLASLVAADVTSVNNALSLISTDLGKLDTDTNAVVSGVVGLGSALQVSVDAVAVDNDLLAAIAAVQASSTFSASDSQTLVTSLQNVATAANKSLTDTMSKVSTFQGLTPIVLTSLYQLKEDQDSLGVAFSTKLDSSVLAQGSSILSGVDAAFNAAIQAYSGM